MVAKLPTTRVRGRPFPRGGPIKRTTTNGSVDGKIALTLLLRLLLLVLFPGHGDAGRRCVEGLGIFRLLRFALFLLGDLLGFVLGHLRVERLDADLQAALVALVE